MAWLSGWTYRKKITLSRASGAVTNYQMKLLLGESFGVAGHNVSCEGRCASDFDDIRFTKSDGTTVLDYWIESLSGTTPNQLATIWIEFDSIGTTGTTFYMYYGNAGAAAVSSGVNTFLQFDDFNSDTLDDAWTFVNSGQGGDSYSLTTNEDKLTIVGSKQMQHTPVTLMYRTAYADGDYVQEVLATGPWDANYKVSSLFVGDGSTGGERVLGGIMHESSGSPHTATWQEKRVSNVRTIATAIRLVEPSGDVLISFTKSGTNFFAKIKDGVNTTTGTTQEYLSTATKAGIQCNNDDNINTFTGKFNDYRVRKYLAVEPDWGAWGGTETEETSWITGWLYRKSIALTAGSAVTNYQVKLLIGESSGATGESVDCGALCKTDFSDLRFTTSDGRGQLEYWIESISGVTPNQLATVWVRFNAIGTWPTKFYMYYGKADASAVSNGTTTFLLFDDFDGSSLDTTVKWTLSAGAVTVSGSILKIIGTTGRVWSKTLFSSNVRIRSLSFYTANSDGGNIGFSDSSDYNTLFSPDYETANQLNAINCNPWPTRTNVALGNVGHNAYNTFEIKRNGTTSNIFILNDTVVATNTGSVSNRSLNVHSHASGQDFYHKWIFVGQCLAVEPTSIWGSIEYATVGLLAGWYRRKVFTVSRSNGALSNYPVRITVNEGITPTLSLSDDFDGTENPLATNWTTCPQSSAMQKASGSAKGTTTVCSAYWDADTVHANQYSQIRGGTAVAVGTRSSTGATAAGYLLYKAAGATTLSIYRISAGPTYTLLKSVTVTALTTSDVIRLESVGSVHTGYVNGVAVLSVVDGTTASGYPLIYAEGTTSLISDWQGGNVLSGNCDELCQSDFDDLRFTKSDGTTLLDYWIESVSGVSPNQIAVVWVELDFIAAGDTTFYMYYGNSGAAAASDGEATFPFFDHFPGIAIDTNKWYHWVNNGSTDVASSILTITGHASYNAWGAKTKFGTNYAFRSRAYQTDESGTDMMVFGLDDRSDDGTAVGAGTDSAAINTNGGNKKYATLREGAGSDEARADAITAFTVMEIQRNASTDVRFFLDDKWKTTRTANLPLDTMGIVYYSNNAARLVYVDWCLARPFVLIEPYLGAFGADEDLTTTPPPTTLAPTTLAPTTLLPTTLAPTTLAPTTLLVTTPIPTTILTTLAPTTPAVVSQQAILVGGKLVNTSILFGRLVQ